MSELTYKNDNLDLDVGGQSYKINVYAKGTYYYHPAVMYLRNGDPGYPEEEDLEIEDVDVVWYKVDENDEKVEVEPTEEMTEALNDYLYNLDWDQWDGPEECEPEWDDLHER